MFQMMGASRLKCMVDGTWNGTAPLCLRKIRSFNKKKPYYSVYSFCSQDKPNNIFFQQQLAKDSAIIQRLVCLLHLKTTPSPTVATSPLSVVNRIDQVSFLRSDFACSHFPNSQIAFFCIPLTLP